ncbi:MAG TPA: hypothetical protein PLV72_02440 [Candidatus Magasanikbacteria bacterium]|nr:hypothetical protein [Candidatus Magasanikbacteria bacterium]
MERLNRSKVSVALGFITVVALLGCAFHLCISEASAQPRVSYAKGWPIILKGGDWDSGLATDRVGVGYVWKIGSTALATDLVLVLGDSPRPNFQFPISAGWMFTDRFSLAIGGFYQINPGYDDANLRHMIGIGGGPGWKVMDGVTISFTTGPSIVWGKEMPENVIGWIFQPEISFVF